MNRRQAKKIARHPYPWKRKHRGKTWRADLTLRRLHWRLLVRGTSGTHGWRWGRWDPDLPQDPREIPF